MWHDFYRWTILCQYSEIILGGLFRLGRSLHFNHDIGHRILSERHESSHLGHTSMLLRWRLCGKGVLSTIEHSSSLKLNILLRTFNTGSFFAKSSIFLLFNQIFTIQKTLRHAIWVGQALNFVIYGAGVAAIIYYESPRVGEPWSAVLDGRTLIPLKWWQAQSAIIVFLDIYIFILPLPNLWKLRIPLRRRIPVLAVFSLALLYVPHF
jgi:hypothetical protein